MKKEDYIRDQEAKNTKEKKKKQEEQTSKNLAFEKEKKLRQKRETEENLLRLKEGVKQGEIDEVLTQVAEKGKAEESESTEIKELLKKIDEMNTDKELHHYLPEELRVTKTDIIQSVHDTQKQKEVLKKVEEALNHIVAQVWIGKKIGCNMVASLAGIFNKNLVTLQENYIDIKDFLKAIKN